MRHIGNNGCLRRSCVFLLNYSIGILIPVRAPHPKEKRSILLFRNGTHKLTLPRLSTFRRCNKINSLFCHPADLINIDFCTYSEALYYRNDSNDEAWNEATKTLKNYDDDEWTYLIYHQTGSQLWVLRV